MVLVIKTSAMETIYEMKWDNRGQIEKVAFDDLVKEIESKWDVTCARNIRKSVFTGRFGELQMDVV